MANATSVGEPASSGTTRIGFSPTELAKAIGCHPDTIRDRIHAQHIAAVKLSGRFVIPANEVRRLFGEVPAVLV